MAEAISSENTLSVRRLAAAHAVPRSTLGYRLRGRPDRSRGHAGQAALMEEEEDALVVAVERLCDWHWAPTRPHVQSLAEDLLRLRGDSNRVNLSKRWLDRFLGRHPGLRTTWSEALSSARAAAGLPANIERWIEDLWAHGSAMQLEPADLWNFDEKGVQAASIHRRKVIVRRSRICFDRQRRGPGDRSLTTLIECCSAAGVALPPMIILGGTQTQLGWAQSNLVPSGKFYSYISYILTAI